MSINIDFEKLRKNRQDSNNQLVQIAIKNNDLKLFHQLINRKELDKVLHETNLNISELFQKCLTDDILCTILAGRISKISSRQGNIDEALQLNVCKSFCANYNINISKLPNKKYRPTKYGKIITSKEIKTKQFRLDECLKSFDAAISGKIHGWIFAKVIFGYGGHQDNVFEEANSLCEWVKNYHNNTKQIFVILIDTNLTTKFNNLKEKFKYINNLIITNHYEFQQYIIDNYSFDKI